MPRRRDRHGRGIRGPLAQPNRFAGAPSPIARPSRIDYFNECVTWSISEISQFNPTVLRGIVVGVEEVPHLAGNWSRDRVPMSAALETARGVGTQLVIYERPHELRAASRSHLRRLVHRTIVEQLSTMTGLPVTELTDKDLDED